MKVRFALIITLIAAAVGLEFGGFETKGIWIGIFIVVVEFMTKD